MALLDNVRSGENVGSILRTCDAAAIQRVMVCGITPQPKDATVRKTALGAENSIAVSNFRNSRDALEILKKIGADLVILEGGSADNVFDYCLPEIPVCFVVGNEVHGVDPLLYDAAKQVIHLPMVGRKESLNVAAAFSAAIYAIWCGSLVRKRERK